VADLEYAIFKHDIPGFYAQYVNNLTVKDFRLEWGSSPADYFTYGICCNHYNDVLVEGFKGTNAHPGNGRPDVLFENGVNKIIR
jgi:hypothetical protein